MRPFTFAPDAAVADVGVDGVGEVERRRAGGQALHLALGREHVHLVREEVDAQRVHELLGIARIALPVGELRDPLVGADGLARTRAARSCRASGRRCRTRPSGACPAVRHLDLERLSLRPDHGRVQRLVHVHLGHGDVVLEPPGHRLPQRVDDADRAVAVLDRVDQDADGGQVVDLVELLAALRHLGVDRVEVLGPAGDVGLDRGVLELVVQDRPGLVREPLALVAGLVHERLDLGVAAGCSVWNARSSSSHLIDWMPSRWASGA